ncbi:hypothetical protein [Fluviicola sp.]|uniref:hypothetical protein n=1 Tax=Fluviicola sp. TaxID=1917219 RepID=UPI0031DF14C8
METVLKERLWGYIASHNPELMFELQEKYQVTEYLEQKVAGVLPEANGLLDQGVAPVTVQEICLQQLIEELGPSKFLFVKRILEEEFPIAYDALVQSKLLTYEVLNMLDNCGAIFEKFGFDEQSGVQRALRYAIMGEINEYLN